MANEPEPLGDVLTALREGTVDPAAYVERVCDRIDDRDPEVRALLPEPGRRQRLLDAVEERRATTAGPAADRPPLYCVPTGVKDIVNVDGLTTRAGTELPPTLFTGPQAPAVTALTDAGALVAGKTVTTEFAGHAPGPTRNPQDPGHTPGGSSSGSAAAVAAGMVPLAVGTQTGGSVIRPAAFCGVVGYKASLGRVDMDGIVPRSPSLDQFGLFTPDVGGMATAAAAVCRGWTEATGTRRPTLGVPSPSFLGRASDEALAAFEAGVSALWDRGYDVRRAGAFEDVDAVDGWHRTVARRETADVHEGWFDRHRSRYRPSTVEAILDGRDVSDAGLARAREKQATVREDLHARMDAAGIDVWVTPAAPGPAPAGLDDTGSSAMNRPWTFAGLPALTVPSGTVGGLPVGLQCVGRFRADEELLRWGEGVSRTVR